jgi:hypothetical protein
MFQFMYVRKREEMREGRIKSVEERRALTNGRDVLDRCTFQMLIAKLASEMALKRCFSANVCVCVCVHLFIYIL